MIETIEVTIGKLYKTESPRVLATLVRLLGDLDLAEEALQEAFSVAMEKWPGEGIPNNAYSWLVSTGRFKVIDRLRRTERGRQIVEENFSTQVETVGEKAWEDYLIEDDLLRLIFYCCHPVLPLDSRIALSLKEVCGLSVAEIARAYLVNNESIKKRISRAKALIKEQNIPYALPGRTELGERVNAVLHVIYLVFNEGYAASTGEQHIRRELTREAVYLGRKLKELVATPETLGLLALMLIQESRRKARLTEQGDIIPLDQQDRSLWDQELIHEGIQLIEAAVMSGRLGPYTLQAAIASVHALADSVDSTQWDLIVQYYDMLLAIQASPVVELNRAIAVGMAQGPQRGLELLLNLMDNKQLNSSHTLYAVQADFYRRLGNKAQAIEFYERALDMVQQEPEARYLRRQLQELK